MLSAFAVVPAPYPTGNINIGLATSGGNRIAQPGSVGKGCRPAVTAAEECHDRFDRRARGERRTNDRSAYPAVGEVARINSKRQSFQANGTGDISP